MAEANRPLGPRVAFINKLVSMYPRFKRPTTDAELEAAARLAIASLDMTSSPGYGKLFGSTNESFVETVGVDNLVDLVVGRIKAIRSISIQEIASCSALDLVYLGLCDPQVLFIKGELHKVAKAREGKWRIIWSSSTIDQLVRRVLHGSMQNYEVSVYHTGKLPVCMGMSRYGTGPDGGKTALKARLNQLDDACGTDVVAYDFNVKLDQTVDAAVVTTILYEEPLEESIDIKLGIIDMRKVAINRDGAVLNQLKDGIKPSGLYGTASGNSRERASLKVQASGFARDGSFGIHAMGDDAMEEWRPDLVQLYADIGVQVKLVERLKDGCMEFCSLNFFPDGTVKPSKPYRLLANFLWKWPPPERFEERYKQLMVIDLEGADKEVVEEIENVIELVRTLDENEREFENSL